MSDARARDVARALVEASALTYQPRTPVTFRSGLRSPMYVDGRRLIFHPGPWRVVIEALRSTLEHGPVEADVVAGVETAGIPHSSALAFASAPALGLRSQGGQGPWPRAAGRGWGRDRSPGRRSSRTS